MQIAICLDKLKSHQQILRKYKSKKKQKYLKSLLVSNNKNKVLTKNSENIKNGEKFNYTQ